MIAHLKRVSRALAALPLAITLMSGAAPAQTYPSRNITLGLPFAAGSGTDTTTRLISKEVRVALRVSMVLDNKAGANGSTGASYVARSASDGHTLLLPTYTTQSAHPYLLPHLSYDSMN